MQGRVPRGIERQTFSSPADFQGIFSGLRRGSHPNHRRNGFFIRDRHVPGGRERCLARGKKGNSTRVTGMATEDYRDGRPWASLVIRRLLTLPRKTPGKQKCEMFHVERCTCICVNMFMYVQREENETTQTSYEASEGTPKSGQN